MIQPRIDSVTVHFRRGSPPRTPRAGDEKMIRGVLHVRQQVKHGTSWVVSNGRPVWEWVEWGSERDYNRQHGRYRTFRMGNNHHHGEAVPPPPEGWKILEAGRPVPALHMVFVHEYGAELSGWRVGPRLKSSFEACAAGVNRAYAIRKTLNELTRDYFEGGCLCIGKLFKKRGPEIGAERAVKFYTSRCKCSRHPEYSHATTE